MSTNKFSSRKFINFLGSKKFFALVVGLLVFQAAWIALTARYPQAFDEQFHFGLIQLHASQLNPVFSHEPVGAEPYGAISRDPSFLYHYLLSFPYRVVAQLTHNLTVQVITLRFINIGIMFGALFVLRRVLLLTKASMALVHSCLFFFVITPVMPLLASQINYDNLLILLVGLSVLRCLQFLDTLHRQKIWRWETLTELAIICLLASLVKYAFLPIFAVLALFVINSWWRSRRNIRIRNPLRAMSKLRLAVYIVLLLLSAGLFTERYGVNTVRYHTPTPECDQVLNVAECQEYAPWARNYYNLQHKVTLTHVQKTAYPLAWLKHSMSELVFAIGSGYNKDGIIDYYVGTQLPVLLVLGWGFLVMGLLLAVVYRKWYWHNQAVRIFMAISGVYLLTLLAQSWLEYIHLGQLTAIHGRYLLPILPFLFITIAIGLHKLVASKYAADHMRNLQVKAATVIIVALLMTQGGGIVTYIVRSDFWWFWPQSGISQRLNADAKNFLRPLVIGV